jgi:hypothetical protein
MEENAPVAERKEADLVLESLSFGSDILSYVGAVFW